MKNVFSSAMKSLGAKAEKIASMPKIISDTMGATKTKLLATLGATVLVTGCSTGGGMKSQDTYAPLELVGTPKAEETVSGNTFGYANVDLGIVKKSEEPLVTTDSSSSQLPELSNKSQTKLDYSNLENSVPTHVENVDDQEVLTILESIIDLWNDMSFEDRKNLTTSLSDLVKSLGYDGDLFTRKRIFEKLFEHLGYEYRTSANSDSNRQIVNILHRYYNTDHAQTFLTGNPESQTKYVLPNGETITLADPRIGASAVQLLVWSDDGHPTVSGSIKWEDYDFRFQASKNNPIIGLTLATDTYMLNPNFWAFAKGTATLGAPELKFSNGDKKRTSHYGIGGAIGLQYIDKGVPILQAEVGTYESTTKGKSNGIETFSDWKTQLNYAELSAQSDTDQWLARISVTGGQEKINGDKQDYYGLNLGLFNQKDDWHASLGYSQNEQSNTTYGEVRNGCFLVKAEERRADGLDTDYSLSMGVQLRTWNQFKNIMEGKDCNAGDSTGNLKVAGNPGFVPELKLASTLEDKAFSNATKAASFVVKETQKTEEVVTVTPISTPTISLADQTVQDNGGGLSTDLPAPTISGVQSGAVYSISHSFGSNLTIDPTTWVQTWNGNLFTDTSGTVTITVVNVDWGTSSGAYTLTVQDNI